MKATGPTHDPQFAACVLAPLAALRRRCRLYLAIDGLTRLMLWLVAASILQILIDRWLRLSVDQRVVLNFLITVLWLWALERCLLARIATPLPDERLAEAVDRAHPALQGRLAAAVQYARAGSATADESPQLIAALRDQACRLAGTLRFSDALAHRRAQRRALELVLLAALPLAAAFALPGVLPVWFQRNWLLREIPWPQQTHIVPVGFDRDGVRRLPRGEPLDIAALNVGRVPAAATLRWSRLGEGGGGSESMTRVGENRWEASLGVLTDDVVFSIEGGDERTRDFRVVAVDRPRIVRLTIRVRPPPYTGLEPQVYEQKSVLEVLEGSVLEIEALASKPLSAAQLVGGNDLTVDAQIHQGSQLTLELTPPASGAFALRLFDREGWESARSETLRIKVAPDAPPTVRLQARGFGPLVTPRADLRIELSAQDTYGLADAGLHVQRNDEPSQPVPGQRPASGTDSWTVIPTVSAAGAGLRVGDHLRLWGEAIDQKPDRPAPARSEVLQTAVVSPPEFLESLAQREEELRREFERLISRQRGLSENLERIGADWRAGLRSEGLGERLARLARTQDAHARQSGALARRFEEILAELRTNRLARPSEEVRVGQRIVRPLDVLAEQSMPQASETLQGLRRGASDESLDAALAQQRAIQDVMAQVLAQMREQEGLREAVILLEEIIGAQDEIRQETLRALAQRVDAILGADEPPTSQP